MKTIEFKGKEYQCPESWRDISLKMQVEAHNLSQNEKYVKAIGVLSAYTKIPVEDLKRAEKPLLMETMKHLAFINTPISDEPLFEFEYKGEKYNILESMTKNQFQDYVSLQTVVNMYKDDNWKQLSYIIAIMAKKQGETLDDYDIEERAKYFEDIDVETLTRVSAFFLKSKKALNLITVFSSPQIQAILVEDKLNELKNIQNRLKAQRGGNLLIRLWIFVSKHWLRFYMRQWEKSYNSQHSKKPKKTWKEIWKGLRLKKQKIDTK